VTHELPNFSEFLTWMETTGEDARAFLLATSQSIVTYDTTLADVSGLFTNGPVNRWMRTRGK
jgi:hypothetical protein